MNNKLEDLKHYITEIDDGGKIIILDTGAIIGPESSAMLQALHSRSTGGLENHLKILAEKGSENFMKNFYVGYGHKSIGDCGSTSIFIEGVSLLVAKAIQDWPLYSGQESSTRYIDFQVQPFKNPINTIEGKEILETWRKFYSESMEETKQSLKKRFPRDETENENIYNKAINARAFDTLRGFLPAGATTNLAWHTNLRQAADKIMILRHSPMKEVRNVAKAIEETLKKAYPNSFNHEIFSTTEEYNKYWMETDYYYHNPNCSKFEMTNNSINTNLLKKDILEKRPLKTELPKYLSEAGTIQFEFTLDFGSFRDLQRHRSVSQRMPLLTTEIGFEDWYLDELPSEIKLKAETLLKLQSEKINNLKISKEAKQYYIPMGYKISNRLTGGLPGIVYIAELRATHFVHPTLRSVAKMIADKLSETFGKNGLILHIEKEMDRFDIKRGEHDIVLK
jgi:thymidylate synthase ThyX